MKPSGSTIEESEMAYDILAYLSEHPDAQDTLQGIVEWWLLEQEIKSRITQVEQALSQLVEKGLVLENKRRDSQTRYKINPRKLKQVKSILQQKARRPSRSGTLDETDS